MIECAAILGDTGIAANAFKKGLSPDMSWTLPNRVESGRNFKTSGLSSVTSRSVDKTRDPGVAKRARNRPIGDSATKLPCCGVATKITRRSSGNGVTNMTRLYRPRFLRHLNRG